MVQSREHLHQKGQLWMMQGEIGGQYLNELFRGYAKAFGFYPNKMKCYMFNMNETNWIIKQYQNFNFIKKN